VLKVCVLADSCTVVTTGVVSTVCGASWAGGADYNLGATPKTVRGSNPGGGEIFRTCPDRPWGPSSLLYNGYRVLIELRSGRSVTLSPHLFKCRGQEIVELYLYSPMGRTACTEPQCLYKGALYLLFTLPQRGTVNVLCFK